MENHGGFGIAPEGRRHSSSLAWDRRTSRTLRPPPLGKLCTPARAARRPTWEWMSKQVYGASACERWRCRPCWRTGQDRAAPATAHRSGGDGSATIMVEPGAGLAAAPDSRRARTLPRSSRQNRVAACCSPPVHHRHGRGSCALTSRQAEAQRAETQRRLTSPCRAEACGRDFETHPAPVGRAHAGRSRKRPLSCHLRLRSYRTGNDTKSPLLPEDGARTTLRAGRAGN
jgi:hypothetical protein